MQETNKRVSEPLLDYKPLELFIFLQYRSSLFIFDFKLAFLPLSLPKSSPHIKGRTLKLQFLNTATTSSLERMSR